MRTETIRPSSGASAPLKAIAEDKKPLGRISRQMCDVVGSLFLNLEFFFG